MANPLLNRPYDDEDEQQSVLRRIGNFGLSGLAKLSAGFDLPGSMIRDVATLHNPFDQLLSPLSFDNRTSGRDLLRQYGLASQEDTTPNWWAGLGAELATDPFTFAAGGGLLKAAAGGIKGLGGASKVAKAAQAGEGLLSVGVPFVKSTQRQVFTGPAAQKAAETLHQAAEYVGTSYPAQTARAIFNSAVKGRQTPEAQQFAKDLFEREGIVQPIRRAQTTGLARQLEQAGQTGQQAGDVLRRELETPTAVASPEIKDVAQQMADINADIVHKSQFWGLPSSHLQDDGLGYATRHVNEKLVGEHAASGAGQAGPFLLSAKGDQVRDQLLKGFTQGTEGVNKLFSDDALKQQATNWNSAIEAARKQGATDQQLKQLRKQAEQDVTQGIGRSYGNAIQQTFQPIDAKGRKLWELPNGKKQYDFAAPQGAKPALKDRHEGLAQWMLDRPDYFEHKVFPNHPLVDMEAYAMSHENRFQAVQTAVDHLSKLAKPAKDMDLKDSVALGSIFKDMGVHPTQVGKRLADALNVSWDQATGKELLRRRVPKTVADDLLRAWPEYQVPPHTGQLLNTLDSMSNLWKAGVLTWPATIVRNATSGAIQNMLKGWLDLPAFMDAHRLAQGQTIKGLDNVKELRDWVKAKNLPINDENLTEGLRQMYGALHAGHHLGTDVLPGAMPTLDPGLESILQRVPGRFPQTTGEALAKVGNTFIGREPNTSLNPFKVRGVGGNLHSEFGPAASADILNNYVDTLNRAAPLIYRLRKGENAADVMKEIGHAQVDYSARNFTREETSVLKRAFPFYSFSKGMLHYVATELMNHPGGPMRQLIRATANARSHEPGLPDYLSDTVAIPLGESDDGTKRFLTGFGLMHEDPASFVGSPKDMLLEAASRLHPLPKGILEYMTGQSFFQRGADGGRPLEDLDPAIGRTLANVGNLTGLRESTDAVRFPLSNAVEQLSANLPTSRLVSTARTLTDTRKGALTKATNLLTGLRISDVSPGAQDRATIERLSSALKEIGGRTFEESYVPKNRLEAMPADQRDIAEELIALKKQIESRRKQRKLAMAQAK